MHVSLFIWLSGLGRQTKHPKAVAATPARRPGGLILGRVAGIHLSRCAALQARAPIPGRLRSKGFLMGSQFPLRDMLGSIGNILSFDVVPGISCGPSMGPVDLL